MPLLTSAAPNPELCLLLPSRRIVDLFSQAPDLDSALPATILHLPQEHESKQRTSRDHNKTLLGELGQLTGSMNDQRQDERRESKLGAKLSPHILGLSKLGCF